MWRVVGSGCELNSPTHPLTHLMHSLTHLIHSHSHSPIHSLTSPLHSVTHPLAHSHSLTHSLTHSMCKGICLCSEQGCDGSSFKHIRACAEQPCAKMLLGWSLMLGMIVDKCCCELMLRSDALLGRPIMYACMCVCVCACVWA
jgi:hypothetical protein